MSLLPMKNSSTLSYKELCQKQYPTKRRQELSGTRETVRNAKRVLPIEEVFEETEEGQEYPKFLGNGWMEEIQPEDENLSENDLDEVNIIE